MPFDDALLDRQVMNGGKMLVSSPQGAAAVAIVTNKSSTIATKSAACLNSGGQV